MKQKPCKPKKEAKPSKPLNIGTMEMVEVVKSNPLDAFINHKPKK